MATYDVDDAHHFYEKWMETRELHSKVVEECNQLKIYLQVAQDALATVDSELAVIKAQVSDSDSVVAGKKSIF